MLVVQGPPFRPKLRLLAERFLNRKIQGGAHDSIEDARAALDLAKLKIRCVLRTQPQSLASGPHASHSTPSHTAAAPCTEGRFRGPNGKA